MEKSPNNSLTAQIVALKRGSLEDLRSKYKEVFDGEVCNSKNRIFLWRKIAYKLQEKEYGGLSDKAQGALNELIEKYDPVNNKSLRPEISAEEKITRKCIVRDKRLPIPGAIIRKEYKGKTLEVTVLDNGFEFEGKPYKTLSSIAKKVTGAHWNGFLFFSQ